MRVVQFFCRSQTPPLEVWVNPAFITEFQPTDTKPGAKCRIHVQTGSAACSGMHIYVEQTPTQVAQMLMGAGT